VVSGSTFVPFGSVSYEQLIQSALTMNVVGKFNVNHYSIALIILPQYLQSSVVYMVSSSFK
jgi:hypothetical protein